VSSSESNSKIVIVETVALIGVITAELVIVVETVVITIVILRALAVEVLTFVVVAVVATAADYIRGEIK
jgi:hypothetical protein